MPTAATNRTTRPADPQPETTPPLALAPEIGQPILTGSRAVPNNAPLIRRLINIRLADPVAKLILLTAAAYCNPWAGDDQGGVCTAANSTLWKLAEVGRATFYRKWEFLKGLGLVSVRRRGRTKGGEGMTAETIIRAVPIRPAGFRSAQAEHLQTAQSGFRSAQSGTFRSAQADNPKDLDLGSVDQDIAAAAAPPAVGEPGTTSKQRRGIADMRAELADAGVEPDGGPGDPVTRQDASTTFRALKRQVDQQRSASREAARLQAKVDGRHDQATDAVHRMAARIRESELTRAQRETIRLTRKWRR